jgi:hypothetical protein
VHATLRRSELTRSISTAGKSQAFGERLPSPAVRREWDLAQQNIAGKVGAQEQLFKAHTARLFRTAFAMLRNKADRSAFSTWLTRIAMNSALMRRQRRNVHAEASLGEILDNHFESTLHRAVDERPNSEQACLAIEVKALIEGQIHELAPPQLSDLEGFTWKR